MAKSQSGSTSSNSVKQFDDKLSEDVNDFHLPDNVWSQARNAINNSVTGDIGKLGNEPSNKYCVEAKYTIIGGIHIDADIWAIFSTNDTLSTSEIGLFKETGCIYKTIIDDPCLNFSTFNLIRGVSKASSDCNYKLYWDDGLNPSRALVVVISNTTNNTPANIFDDNLYTNQNSTIPWIQTCLDSNGNSPTSPNYPQGCITCTNTPALNCELIRLARHVQTPCVSIKKGVIGGTLANGSYFAVIAYTIFGQRVTDYFTPSNLVPLFDHDNVAGSIDITITNADTTFAEFELVVVATINSQTIAKRIGLYNITQTQITLDTIDPTLSTVPIELISIETPVIEKTDAMYNVNTYLIRVAPTSKFDFNYQPLANQIRTKWQNVEYPVDYYKNGGTNTGYMRDEIYSFFIQWIYNTGDKSSSYHIPGRPLFSTEPSATALGGGTDALPAELGTINYIWAVNNLATQIVPFVPILLPDGGKVVAEGYMGYWESTEYYSNTKPEVWDANYAFRPWTSPNTVPYPNTLIGSSNPTTGVVVLGNYDLCGKPIRHHRFPDNAVSNSQTTDAHHFANGGLFIRVMGVKFENVRPPVDNDGVLIPNIIGYEILRGSRNGNKTVIAKGIINNMRQYDLNKDLDNKPFTPTPTTINPAFQGYYQNYPYNDLRQDPFLSRKPTSNNFIAITQASLQSEYSKKVFTFHSPDTTFAKPFLSSRELKTYGQYIANVTGNFVYSEEHPRAKIVTNMAFLMSAIAGIGLAYLKMQGTKSSRREELRINQTPWTTAYGNGGTLLPFGVVDPAAVYARNQYLLLLAPNKAANESITSLVNLLLGPILGYPTPSDLAFASSDAIASTSASLPNLSGGTNSTDYEYAAFEGLPIAMKVISTLMTFGSYMLQGTDQTLDLIRAALKYREFALKYNSHGLYSTFVRPSTNTTFNGQRRRLILDQSYLGPEILNLNTTIKINNLFRNKTVALNLQAVLVNPPGVTDNTRQTPSLVKANINTNYNALKPAEAGEFGTTSNCYYAALKQRIRNQYGQIDSISQIAINNCYTPYNNLTSSTTTLFGGDIYIGKYSEKTTFFYFYDWLYKQPDGFQFDYNSHKMIPYPTYWLNMEKFETNDFTSNLGVNTVTTFFTNYSSSNNVPDLPNDFYNLDQYNSSSNNPLNNSFRFGVKDAYFYLFNSGIREFFVETEINIDLRDWGEFDSQKHYPIISDVKTIFDTNIIKSGNYYKYDWSLSITKTYLNFVSWATTQTSYYDPSLSETCYTYSPKRVIYSLPAQFESVKDNWLVFLANNYHDFLSYVTCIKPVNKSGAIIFFESASPVQFQGTDQLQTELGTKLTIGDGGLFSQPLQSIMNADVSYEYGSCQDSFSVINTPLGLYWISENQGKIFKYGGGISELSNDNMKWWFAQYLPYQLLNYFPNFELTNNPVSGIGCQSMYDNQNQLLYFTKKDYILKDDIPSAYTVTYISGNQFSVNSLLDGQYREIMTILLGDPRFFKDASWTISYDPKTGGYISYHDWHPTLTFPGKNTFMTVNPNDKKSIWIHNERCDNYCKYYGINYPWEVEYIVNTANQVNTVRSIEYQLEIYKYALNCYDRFHELDFNFDEAVVYNTEQCSGLLKLNLTPKNNAPDILNYPSINISSIDILYSKVEQKYRFNQFWDITRDRGEFPIGSQYPPPTPNVGSYAQQTIWNTEPNGYIKFLNANNLNYDKFALERKKFRHYTTSVLLRRLVSEDKKFLVMLATNKNLYSPR